MPDITAPTDRRPPTAGLPDTTSRRLLLFGVAAGPLYVGVGLVEAFTRTGFDVAHQDLSLLSNGHWGWVHITLLLATGALVLTGTVGVRRVLPRQGPAGTWGPRLLGVYGSGLCAAGAFVADPMSGFPTGTPPGRPARVSWHGNLHFLSGAIAFVALIAACLLFARRFAAQGQTRWSRYTLLTGIAFTAAFAGIATGSSSAAVVIGFGVAVVAAFTWLTALCLMLRDLGFPNVRGADGRRQSPPC